MNNANLNVVYIKDLEIYIASFQKEILYLIYFSYVPHIHQTIHIKASLNTELYFEQFTSECAIDSKLTKFLLFGKLVNRNRNIFSGVLSQ